jgi:SAM-dependent methyltransferase
MQGGATMAQTHAGATVTAPAPDGETWRLWLSRLNGTEWRTPVFFEIVSSEIAARSGAARPTVLDIGCGLGFDGEVRFQRALATQAGRFIGIEPDLSVEPPRVFSEVFRTALEDAPIERGSVDVAYAIMVMEHVAQPAAFWARLHEILAPGGVFLAFSVNGGHWFAPVTRLLSATKLKTRYLDLVQGKRGTERYADYPVYYRTNTPEQVRRMARDFRAVNTLPFGATGIVAAYAPPRLRPLVRTLDGVAYRLRGQCINIVIRAER